MGWAMHSSVQFTASHLCGVHLLHSSILLYLLNTSLKPRSRHWGCGRVRRMGILEVGEVAPILSKKVRKASRRR